MEHKARFFPAIRRDFDRDHSPRVLDSPRENPCVQGETVAIFRVFDGRELVGEFFFDEGPITVGRHPNSDIFINQEVVSRHHAVIKKTGQTWSVEKTEGRNGIFINGQYADFQLLKPNDRIEVGHTMIEFSESKAMRAAAARRQSHEPGAAFYRSMDEVMSLLNQTEDLEIEGDDLAWDVATGDITGRAPDLHDADDDDDDDTSSATVMLTVDQVAQRHVDYETELRAHLSWKDAQGKTHMVEVTQDLIVLGRGRDAHIPVKGGLGIGNRFAVVSQTAQGVQVERTSRLVSVKVNGESIKGSVLLHDNDVLAVCDTNIIFHRGVFD